MEEGIIRITPDKKKAKSILKMAETTLEMVKAIDLRKFSSNVTKEYYDIIRELLSIIILLDGYKTYGEGAHKKLIELFQSKYKELSEYEMSLIDDLRIKRNKIAYDGFFVDKEYIETRTDKLEKIINKLKKLINKKL
jgi:hypothetical protein